MAVAFGSIGAVIAGTTSLSVAYPASISAGDLLVLHIANKYDPNGPSTPSGWTPQKQQSGGAGASGTDTGVMFATVYTKEADGTESGSLSVTITSGNSSAGVMARYTKAGGTTWGIAAEGGAQNSGTSSWSVTAGADPGLTAGDIALACFGWNGNLVNSTNTQAMTAAGISAWGTVTERADTSHNLGDDSAIAISEHPVTTGTSSAAPVFTATVTGGGSPNANHPAGPVVFLRLREVAGGSYTVDATETATAAESASAAMLATAGATEAASAADAPTAVLTATAAAVEAGAAAEFASAAAVGNYSAGITEAASAADAPTAVLTATAAAVEATTAAESASAAAVGDYSAGISEAASAADAPTAALTAAAATVEAASAAESSTGLPSGAFAASAAETSTATDTSSTTATKAAAAAEAATAADACTALRVTFAAVLEPATPIDVSSGSSGSAAFRAPWLFIETTLPPQTVITTTLPVRTITTTWN